MTGSFDSKRRIDAALLPLADRLSQLDAVKVFDGTTDSEGWWQLLFHTDAANDDAWRTVAILASLFNAGDRADATSGRPILFPVALPAPEFDPEKGPYWSLSRLQGDYTPDTAAAELRDHLANLPPAGAPDANQAVWLNGVRIDPRLISLSTRLSALPGVRLLYGAVDRNCLWRLLFAIDIENADAWRTVRILASIFNTRADAEDAALFVPVYRPRHESVREDRPYWWLKVLRGNFAPDAAGKLIDAHFARLGCDGTGGEG